MARHLWTLLRRFLLVFWSVLVCAPRIPAEHTHSDFQNAAEKKPYIDSFEVIWSTLRDRYWDSTMAGLDWQAIHREYLKKVQAANDPETERSLMMQMMRQLPSSHLALIPKSVYPAHEAGSAVRNSSSQNQTDDADGDGVQDGTTGLTATVIDGLLVVEAVEKDSAAMQSGVRMGWTIESIDGVPVSDMFRSIRSMKQIEPPDELMADIVEYSLRGPVGSTIQMAFVREDGKQIAYDLVRRPAPGKLVEFGNLPPEQVCIEHRKLNNGVGYIRLNIFLDALSVMPEVEKAVREFKDAPAIILDLRNNPGGVGMIAMGIAGWFVSTEGLELGTMTGRDVYMKFEINPRLDAYTGRMAVLVNEGSASTSEILAQGLQDLGRARIFGTKTAGAALPSSIIELPDGDRFQYPEANYVSAKGRVLEGNGVQPDVVVKPTTAALLQGRDLVLEAASEWGAGK